MLWKALNYDNRNRARFRNWAQWEYSSNGCCFQKDIYPSVIIERQFCSTLNPNIYYDVNDPILKTQFFYHHIYIQSIHELCILWVLNFILMLRRSVLDLYNMYRWCVNCVTVPVSLEHHYINIIPQILQPVSAALFISHSEEDTKISDLKRLKLYLEERMNHKESVSLDRYLFHVILGWCPV